MPETPIDTGFTATMLCVNYKNKMMTPVDYVVDYPILKYPNNEIRDIELLIKHSAKAILKKDCIPVDLIAVRSSRDTVIWEEPKDAYNPNVITFVK